jgi:XTP/dITP diphosphohydrolase
MQLVIASNNIKKRREITEILGALGIEILPVEETTFVPVVEDGDAFAANARKKAEAFAHANNHPALADDSGLCVNALGGAPGVYSSRYAGGLDGGRDNDTANNAKLLRELAGQTNRKAYFTCHLHLAFPDGSAPLTTEGHVDGEILTEPDGDRGFGYDPLFFCPELGKSFASASAEEKASVSHRGRALRALHKKLEDYLAADQHR